MLKYLSFKYKNYALTAGFILFLVIAYQLSFIETINQYEKYNYQQDKLKSVSNAALKIESLKMELNDLKNNLGNNNKTTDFQRELLSKTSLLCSNSSLNIEQFPKPLIGIQGQFSIETYQFVLEGPFYEQVKYLNTLENEWRIGKLISVNLESKKNSRTKEIKLYSNVYLQNIIPIK